MQVGTCTEVRLMKHEGDVAVIWCWLGFPFSGL